MITNEIEIGRTGLMYERSTVLDGLKVIDSGFLFEGYGDFDSKGICFDRSR